MLLFKVTDVYCRSGTQLSLHDQLISGRPRLDMCLKCTNSCLFCQHAEAAVHEKNGILLLVYLNQKVGVSTFRDYLLFQISEPILNFNLSCQVMWVSK
jgi:hypothetical protein